MNLRILENPLRRFETVERARLAGFRETKSNPVKLAASLVALIGGLTIIFNLFSARQSTNSHKNKYKK